MGIFGDVETSCALRWMRVTHVFIVVRHVIYCIPPLPLHLLPPHAAPSPREPPLPPYPLLLLSLIIGQFNATLAAFFSTLYGNPKARTANDAADRFPAFC